MRERVKRIVAMFACCFVVVLFVVDPFCKEGKEGERERKGARVHCQTNPSSR